MKLHTSWSNFTVNHTQTNLGTICKSTMVEVPCQLASPTEETGASCLLHTKDTGQGRHLWSSPMVQHHTQEQDGCTGPWTQCQPKKYSPHLAIHQQNVNQNLTLLTKLSFKKVFYLTWHPDTWKLVGHISTVPHFSTLFSLKSTKTLLVFMHN